MRIGQFDPHLTPSVPNNHGPLPDHTTCFQPFDTNCETPWSERRGATRKQVGLDSTSSASGQRGPSLVILSQSSRTVRPCLETRQSTC